MLVRFWGTRGSFPSRSRLRTSRRSSSRRSSGRRAGASTRRTRRGPSSSASSTFPCRTPSAATPRAWRSRRAAATTSCATSAAARAPSATTCSPPVGRRGNTLPRLHVPRALGPHHGLPVLHAGLHARQPTCASTAATPRSRGLPPPERGAVVSRGLLADGRADRVRAPRARPRLRDRRPLGARQAPAPRRRLVRLPVRAGRQGRRLLHRLRAQAGRPRGDPGVRGLLRATPTSSSSTPCTPSPTPSR